jgi:hypothetical protein
MGLISHTMVGNLPHTDAMFTPGPQGVGNSAHFGTAQDGTVIQWVPLGVIAEHAKAANDHWYAVENADDRNPNNPYTDAQLSRIAQILELTSRPEYGRFTLQVTNSPDQEGLGRHNMGGVAWGGHSCPDAQKTRTTLARGPAPRSYVAQRSSGSMTSTRSPSQTRPDVG